MLKSIKIKDAANKALASGFDRPAQNLSNAASSTGIIDHFAVFDKKNNERAVG